MSKKIIEIKNLSYSYPDKTKALSGIDMDVYDGDCLGIIGPNGSGKTTLLLHLNGILMGAGTVKINGLEVEDKNFSSIRSMVGMVFQDPDAQLFMPTVFDDIAFGPINMGLSKDDVNLSVEKALSQVDMLKSKDKIAHHLSFGEKRRASIATVLSMSPNILAMDEPTSNLDPKHRKMLIQLIKEFNHTKVIVSHDLDMLSDVCNRLIILKNGSIVAQGNTADILNNQALLESNDLI